MSDAVLYFLDDWCSAAVPHTLWYLNFDFVVLPVSIYYSAATYQNKWTHGLTEVFVLTDISEEVRHNSQVRIANLVPCWLVMSKTPLGAPSFRHTAEWRRAGCYSSVMQWRSTTSWRIHCLYSGAAILIAVTWAVCDNFIYSVPFSRCGSCLFQWSDKRKI